MRKINRQLAFIVLPITAVIVVIVATIIVSGGKIAILDPAGTIAAQQRNVLGIAFGLMLLIVLPVFGLTFFIAWKYRAGNEKADYKPDWEGSKKLELAWWSFPLVIVAILAAITWVTSHTLDPSVAIKSDKKPYVVQVVSLQWKWLFLYPEDKIATVGYVAIPADRPIDFQITADSPMNSFWVPRLGGQIYAMSGMTTRLNLEADHPGSYHGVSANISGEGFADMTFVAEAKSDIDFKNWTNDMHNKPKPLTLAAYTALARPDTVDGELDFSSYEPGLYNTIIAKYNQPGALKENN